MASKAVAKAMVDWSSLSSRVHSSDIPRLNQLKSKVDASIIKVASLPESLPKIDWSFYKANVSDPKIVEAIEKSYSMMKVERPKAMADRLNELNEAQELDERRYQKFVEVAQSYIDSAAVVKTKFENMILPEDWTMDDYALTFPEWNHSVENPSLGPNYGRTAGLTREEAAAFDQPDPVPWSTKTAWKDWEIRKKKFYSD